MNQSDDFDLLNKINKVQGAERRFFFEILMHMNGCDRDVAAGLYPLVGDSARACIFLYQRQQIQDDAARERFAALLPADAFRFIQIMEHFGRDPEQQPLALSDFLELLAQEPESLREFLSLSDTEKTSRFSALMERFHSRDADVKSSLDSITEGRDDEILERRPPDDPGEDPDPDSIRE